MFILRCPRLILAIYHKPLVSIFNDCNLNEIKRSRILDIRDQTLMYKFKAISIPDDTNCSVIGKSSIPAPMAKPTAVESTALRGSIDKFPDFFCMGTFIDSTHNETLLPFQVISPGINALVVPFQQLLEGSMEVLLCERVNDLRHSLFHLLNCLITTASELKE